MSVERSHIWASLRLCRLRQVDVKAEHFERQVQKLEQERDAMEAKYDVGFSLLIPAQTHQHPFIGSTREGQGYPKGVGRPCQLDGRCLIVSFLVRLDLCSLPYLRHLAHPYRRHPITEWY